MHLLTSKATTSSEVKSFYVSEKARQSRPAVRWSIGVYGLFQETSGPPCSDGFSHVEGALKAESLGSSTAGCPVIVGYQSGPGIPNKNFLQSTESLVPSRRK